MPSLHVDSTWCLQYSVLGCVPGAPLIQSTRSKLCITSRVSCLQAYTSLVLRGPTATYQTWRAVHVLLHAGKIPAMKLMATSQVVVGTVKSHSLLTTYCHSVHWHCHHVCCSPHKSYLLPCCPFGHACCNCVTASCHCTFPTTSQASAVLLSRTSAVP
jgi:hypothetical protein